MARADLELRAEVEIGHLNRTLDTFAAEMGRDIGELLPQQAKLLTQDLQHLTPPFASMNPKESFASQRKVGLAAVARDIGHAFADISELGIFQNPRSEKQGKRARDLLATGSDYDLWQFLDHAGYGEVIGHPTAIIAEPTEDLHNRAKDRRGRVPRGRSRLWVRKAKSLGRFVKATQKKVGKEKGGWNRAAATFGARAPSWISGQPSRGEVVNKAKAPLNPFVVLRNQVSYVGDSDRQIRFVSLAVSLRTNAMIRQLEAKARGAIRRFR